MRRVVHLEGTYSIVEDMFYAIGDADDFIDRERKRMHDLIEGVADGKLSASSAKREIDLAFSNAAKQIEEARQLLAGNARRAGFSYLHSSLLLPESPVAPTLPAAMPLVRIVAPLPEGA